MSAHFAGSILTERIAQFKQTQTSISEAVQVFVPKDHGIIIKPSPSSWEELVPKLQKVINLPGLLTTVRELYDQGYGAELETAVEIALAKARKSSYCLFASMVSKRAGNWQTKTMQVVHETWEVRRNARRVMERLKLSEASTKAILALAWRLKASILRYVGIAMEQGTGITNPVGLFFALTKKQPLTS